MVKVQSYKEDKAVDFIYETSDYSKFKNLQGNRVINVAHLENLKESFRKQVLKSVVYVNENFEIIDGQHRFQVLMQKKLPIQYIVCEGYGLDEVQIYNQNSKNWSTEDFLDSYCKLGNEEYLTFRKFMNVHKFPLSVLFVLFWSDASGFHKRWKDGTIKITNLEQANRVAYKLGMVRKVIGAMSCKREFVRAFMRVSEVPGYNQNQMLSKLELFKTQLEVQASAYGYIEMLDSIYNYHQPAVKKLDILGYLRKKGYAQASVKKFTKKK